MKKFKHFIPTDINLFEAKDYNDHLINLFLDYELSRESVSIQKMVSEGKLGIPLLNHKYFPKKNFIYFKETEYFKSPSRIWNIKLPREEKLLKGNCFISLKEVFFDEYYSKIESPLLDIDHESDVKKISKREVLSFIKQCEKVNNNFLKDLIKDNVSNFYRIDWSKTNEQITKELEAIRPPDVAIITAAGRTDKNISYKRNLVRWLIKMRAQSRWKLSEIHQKSSTEVLDSQIRKAFLLSGNPNRDYEDARKRVHLAFKKILKKHGIPENEFPINYNSNKNNAQLIKRQPLK